ncbi:gp43 [Burkholderia pseudomallei]|uniref:hypothetical protein n=1 Tax=Burkholderia pseudomallei TaxID=28450 RepID=UPI000F11811D|nr:hypothetical protein [Burkholderia pseudomallei]CAJ2929094.1 gp43 [Burkholderia pseudomallei]VBW57551.1 gp43 [Burkholderia pseudomallei]VBW77962.1 gp43 [Burkholderia pseudomallei]VBW79802.1 gp43 [Burkholderia pseudomallei]VBW79860.1 gp43 [Burkholderia pseudomallei]
MTENNCRTGTVTNDQSAIFIACAHRLDEVGSQYLAEELRSVQCDLLAASPVEQPAAAPIDDARKCLMEVVSHHDSIVAGFAAQRLAAEEAQDSDAAAYWKHESDVAHRMKAQADRALAAMAQSAPSPAVSFEAWCDRFPEISAVERLRDAWQEARAAASPAMAAEAVAFEITEQAAAEWASRHDVDHVLKHFSTQRNAIEDARTLHLLAAAPQPAQAGARVGLTDEQRDAIDFVIGWYEQSTIADNPYREHIAALRALLSARPAESWQVEIDAYKREVRELEAVLRIPEKIEDDWIRADVHSPTEAGIPHDDDVLAWNNDPGFATIISASFISPSFPEYTHWKKKPEAPADIDHAKGVDHAE